MHVQQTVQESDRNHWHHHSGRMHPPKTGRASPTVLSSKGKRTHAHHHRSYTPKSLHERGHPSQVTRQTHTHTHLRRTPHTAPYPAPWAHPGC
eukprot:1159040-Pelagomonas_calceolata.AAC.12